MATTSRSHHELNERGEGLRSVPMFVGYAMPAGFCDEPAYGEQTKEYLRQFRPFDEYHQPAYAPGLACPCHGGPQSRVFRDGDSWCAVMPNFINLQESKCGFGDSPKQARAAITAALEQIDGDARKDGAE